jgi:hypothetical protein
MRAMAAMLLVLILPTGVFAQSKRVGTFQFEKKQGAHKALVIFRTRALPDAGRRVTQVEQGQTMVDGRPAIGTDGNIPGVEIVSMRFYLDGKEIKIPRRLYADCFDPNFGKEDVTLRFGPAFRSVIVSMLGSDGGGAYEVTWTLVKDGQHRRSIDRP